MGAPDPSAQPGIGWDEAQCMAALAQLEQLQAQIDDLRLAIPKIIEPFHRPTNSSTFKIYSQGVIGSQNGIKSLSDTWRKPEIQELFVHARKSQEANPDLSASTSVPSHGWVERERRERESRKGGGEHTTVNDQVNSSNDGDISVVVKEFQMAHPNIKLETHSDGRGITTQFFANSMKLSFKVNIERMNDARQKLTAECLGASEPFLSITRCIATRPEPNDLKRLLEMIAAYETVKGTTCAKCGKLLDAATLTPTARRPKQTTSANDNLELVWESLHEGCL